MSPDLIFIIIFGGRFGGRFWYGSQTNHLTAPVTISLSDVIPLTKHNWRQNVTWLDLRYNLRGTIWWPFLTVSVKCEAADLSQDVLWNNIHHTVWWPIWWPFLTNSSPSALIPRRKKKKISKILHIRGARTNILTITLWPKLQWWWLAHPGMFSFQGDECCKTQTTGNSDYLKNDNHTVLLYARLKNGRIMLWQCPSVRPSVRPSFPDFFSTCFKISIWNLVYAFSRWHDMSTSSRLGHFDLVYSQK